uniref:Uncharacterized protein n=1 Tax=Sphaerodactylus townsendi TaxID=933632 RepID=A0ACB8FMT3_9SAUR
MQSLPHSQTSYRHGWVRRTNLRLLSRTLPAGRGTPVRRPTPERVGEADKQQRAYEALRLRTEEVTWERGQLQSDLSDLWQQVAFLMAEREREKTALEPSTVEEGVKGDDVEGELRAKLHSLQGQLADLTLNCSPYLQGGGSVTAGRSALSYQRGPMSQGGPRKSFKVDSDGNPDELAFFLI